MDIVPAPGVELADLTQPWPWQDSLADYVRASHVMEHLSDKITMNESWCVLKRAKRANSCSAHKRWRAGVCQDRAHDLWKFPELTLLSKR
jgi:hypothetical protein